MKTFLRQKVEKYEFTPSSFVCAFFPPTKRVISAASADSRDFIVELISHSVAYKHKMPAQICQVFSLLHDTYLSVPSLPVSCLFHSLLSPGYQVTHCQCCAKALLQYRFPLWWHYLVSSCLPCCPWGGALAGGHTHQHRPLKAVRGRKSSQRAPHPLGNKRCVRLPVV